MQSLGSDRRSLGRWIVARPRRVLVAWALALVGIGLGGIAAGADLAPTRLIVPGSGSDRAERLHEERIGPLGSNVVILLEGLERDLDRRGPRLATALRRDLGLDVGSPWIRDPRARELLRPAPDAALITLRFARDSDEGRDRVEEAIVRRADLEAGDALVATVSGPGIVGGALEESALEAVARAELIALPILILVLLLVFRSVAAAAVPLLFGVTTVLAARGAIGSLAAVADVNVFAITVASMMALALGIDYALLLVSRFRVELAEDGDPREAAARTAATAGRTIVIAGSTLASAMGAGLIVAPGGVLFSTVMGALVAALISAASATLAGPALLAVLGDRVNRGRILRRSAGSEPRWLAAVAAALRRPTLTAAAVGGLLLLLAAPALGLRVGPPDARQLPPDDPARTGFERIEAVAGAGWTSPFSLVVALPASPRPEAPNRLAALERRIGADPAIGAVAALPTAAGHAVEFMIVPREGPNTQGTRDLHKRLTAAGERIARDLDAQVAVGGQPAEFADFRAALADRALLLVLAVVLAGGLALLVVLRAPLLPAVASALNLLTVAAAFGVLALLFGGSAPLGGPGFVDAVSLAAAYAVVFGLSIDYYVFLITRMREERERGRSAEDAVMEGVRRTAAVVTGAAAIMVAVFIAFASAETAAIRQLGAALAIAVLLDATVVRLLLLPAVMRLLGDAAWALPRPRWRRIPLPKRTAAS